MEPRVFEYRDWVSTTPPKKVAELRRVVTLGFVMTAVLAVLAIACLAVLISARPLQLQLLAGLVVCSAAALLLLRRTLANRTNLGRVAGDEVSMQGPYPLSVGDDTIHFPESFDDQEDSWPLEGTTAEIKTVTRQQILVLTHQGRTTRHFYAGALVDPLSDVIAEIEARRSSTSPGQEP